jgi:hypothetical protein
VTLRDSLGLGLFFAAVIAFFAIVILGAMKLEAWRSGRGLAAFSAGLTDVRRSRAALPGAWRVDELHGQLGACAIALRPILLEPGRVKMGAVTSSQRMIALALDVRLPDSTTRGAGTLAVRQGALIATGVAPPRDPAALIAALTDAGVTVELAEGAATASFGFPMSARAGRRARAVAAALAAYLTEPAA